MFRRRTRPMVMPIQRVRQDIAYGEQVELDRRTFEASGMKVDVVLRRESTRSDGTDWEILLVLEAGEGVGALEGIEPGAYVLVPA